MLGALVSAIAIVVLFVIVQGIRKLFGLENALDGKKEEKSNKPK